ncbi:MAG TPA: S8 family serine peptidase [Longimicrobiaceae bacterium]|nr:S8 family serine peptidase [Longimicrobiaceae bacterium]
MADPGNAPPFDNRILVKLRSANALHAADPRAGLRPLFDTPRPPGAFGVDAGAQWYVAELRDGGGTAWDVAHARVADQLGIAESDVVFAEPDLLQRYEAGDEEGPPPGALGAAPDCTTHPQDPSHRKAVGPDEFAWHLGDDFTQLASARAAVQFDGRRTRIAHVDTGYYPAHPALPEHVLTALAYNFVEDRPGAEDPDGRALIDNSGHGTGTLGILAGGKVPAGAAGKLPLAGGGYLGGAPHADVVPLRIADSVVLWRTSALARAIDYAVANGCDVMTMSMGGVPAKVWEESIDRAYEAGLAFCAAAGNHFGPLPPRTLVYPARYSRVIAVCGAMADGRPYANLEWKEMEGSFGPESAMRGAIAAYTPNIPWSLFRCSGIRLNGAGTSSATPQVAAAAALWYERYKAVLPRDWQRVEAVRNALFTSARKKDAEHFGNGILQARAALDVAPRFGMKKADRCSSRFAFLRLITGLGVAEASTREEMFNTEVAQRWLMNPDLQEIAPDPEGMAALDARQVKRAMEALIADAGASTALRRHVAARYPVATGGALPRDASPPAIVPVPTAVCDTQPRVGDPPYRRLRVYAMDPSLSTRLETADTSEVTLKVRWEALEPGPLGEYLAVEDVDASGATNDPVDLNDPRLLAQDGWAPAEGNPQFHQQMVYAVVMKTVQHFERALGRPVLWRPRPNPQNEYDDSAFVRRLAVRPHALRQSNAFYSPAEVALLFGYFEAGADDPGDHMPGSRVYACLSHDIVAHEATHAVLDGMHRRFNEPTNPDVLALHEGFADVVALMQHFTVPEVLEREIARTRGDLEAESMLGSLAVQFGKATGGRGALRDAIGRLENGVWKRLVPDPADLAKRVTPHARGAVLVAAVFDAFLAIYRARSADLLRISTGGTGVLPGGAIHPDLVRRLADEAAKSAGHVLNMCIRALDYLPPVDVTFFEYLRALITADFDLVADDRYDYRVAFVDAFRRRGIYPLNLGEGAQDVPRTLSVDTLRWTGLARATLAPETREQVERQYAAVFDRLKRYAGACLYENDRATLFESTREERRALHGELVDAFKAVPAFAAELGLDPAEDVEVHALRSAMRVSPDGRHLPQVVVALVQTVTVPEDPGSGTPAYVFRGGSTLVVDLSAAEIKYRIVKKIGSETRRGRTAAFVREAAADPLRALFLTPRDEPFAALHALADEGL